MVKLVTDLKNAGYIQFIVSTIIWEIFGVKKLLYSSKSTKIKHTKYFQYMYYITERELNYHKVRKFFDTNILHTNIS